MPVSHTTRLTLRPRRCRMLHFPTSPRNTCGRDDARDGAERRSRRCRNTCGGGDAELSSVPGNHLSPNPCGGGTPVRALIFFPQVNCLSPPPPSRVRWFIKPPLFQCDQPPPPSRVRWSTDQVCILGYVP